MNIKNYLKEYRLFLFINIVLYVLLAIFLNYINIEFIWIFGIFIIWFLPITILLLINYTKKVEFYNSVIESIENLDKQYLLTETIEYPDFLEGEIIYEALDSIKKDIHNHIKSYEDMQIGYREYIEMWIHEIKTPIASSKLIIENNKNETTRNIEKEVNKIESFVEQVLYYSRSNDTSKDYIIKEFNLSQAIRDVIKRNSKVFIYKNIKLDIGEIDYRVYTDTKWIAFILNQIIINSIKYSKLKDAQVSIYCKNLASKLGLGISLTSKENIGTKVDVVFPLGKITILES